MEWQVGASGLEREVSRGDLVWVGIRSRPLAGSRGKRLQRALLASTGAGSTSQLGLHKRPLKELFSLSISPPTPDTITLQSLITLAGYPGIGH